MTERILGEHLLSVRGLAQTLSLSTQTIRNWVRHGDIPHFRMARAIRFDRDEVLNWIRDGGPVRAHKAKEMESGTHPEADSTRLG